MADRRWIRVSARYVLDATRCMPVLLLIYLVYYQLPSLGIVLNNWTAGLCALVICHTAYMAEIIRGSWVTLPKEYTETATSFGFYGVQLYRRIILPPIILAAAPMIGNQIIVIVKDTAFLTIIAVAELTHAASSIQSQYYVPFAAYISAIALYWLLCRLIGIGFLLIERSAEARR
jgi:polar amino acid transport system permease protein